MYLVCSKHQRSPPDDQIHLSSDILKFEFFLLLLRTWKSHRRYRVKKNIIQRQKTQLVGRRGRCSPKSGMCSPCHCIEMQWPFISAMTSPRGRPDTPCGRKGHTGMYLPPHGLCQHGHSLGQGFMLLPQHGRYSFSSHAHPLGQNPSSEALESGLKRSRGVAGHAFTSTLKPLAMHSHSQ